jgi:ATP-dependent DNA ligase
MSGQDGEAMFRHGCAMGLEGIVSKRVDSRYKSGRCLSWVKVRNPDMSGDDHGLRAPPGATDRRRGVVDATLEALRYTGAPRREIIAEVRRRQAKR